MVQILKRLKGDADADDALDIGTELLKIMIIQLMTRSIGTECQMLMPIADNTGQLGISCRGNDL